MLAFRQMEAVRAVCQHGSATLAADALGISQPAISALLRSATEQAGFPLFVRRQGRLQPTAETRMLVGELDRIFDAFDRVNRLVYDMRDASVGVVQVAATPVLADNLVPLAISRFRSRRPKVKVTLASMDNLSVVNAVSERRVDFGVVLTPLVNADARLIELFSADLVAVVHPSHPLAVQATVTPADLTPYPLISFSRNLPLGYLVDEAFRKAGVTRRFSLEVNQSSVATALARTGAGVAVIDPFLFMDEQDHGVVRLRLTPPARVKAQLLIPKTSGLSIAARALITALRRLADRHKDLAAT